jgi:hypothetical protein
MSASKRQKTFDISLKDVKPERSYPEELLGEASSDDEEEDEDDDEEDEDEDVQPARNFDIFKQAEKGAGELYVSVGKSRRGKTHFTRALLADQIARKVNPLKFGIIFVKTKFKHSYEVFEKQGYAKVYEGYNEEILKQFVKNLKETYEHEGKVEPNFVVFEDLVGILNNQSQWFINWISTYRHYNTSPFINVQYLLGRGAISPIMREQTSFVMLFNSKCNRTIKNVYENYGQLWPNEKTFKAHYMANTSPSKVGPYVCLVYIEYEDELEKNYIPMKAPAEIAQLPERQEETKPPAEQASLSVDNRQMIRKQLIKSILGNAVARGPKS